jgi:hypothetical protein
VCRLPTPLSGFDGAFGVAVDSGGHAYVTGMTYSTDFPTTPGAFDRTFNGDAYTDAFITVLSPDGSALVYSTFLGGGYGEGGSGIAIRATPLAPHFHVTGGTASPDFPTTPSAFDTTFNGDGDSSVSSSFLTRRGRKSLLNWSPTSIFKSFG